MNSFWTEENTCIFKDKVVLTKFCNDNFGNRNAVRPFSGKSIDIEQLLCRQEYNISKIEPSFGPLAGGNLVTISGENLYSSQVKDVTVEFINDHANAVVRR